MPRLAIRGLVKLADEVRQSLSRPASPQSVVKVRSRVGHALQQLDAILLEHRAGLHHIGRPSRNAVKFLRQIDWDRQLALAVQAEAEGGVSHEDGPAAGSVSLPGVRRDLEAWLNFLVAEREQVFNTKAGCDLRSRLMDVVRRADEMLGRRGLAYHHLRDESRAYLGWCRYVARLSGKRRYLRAVERLFRHLGSNDGRKGAGQIELVGRALQGYPDVQFRPMAGLYRCTFGRRAADKRRVVLAMPTPMIAFRDHEMRAMADWLRGDSSAKHAVVEATRTRRYQRLVHLLELRHTETAAGGMYHDLDAAFQRVNALYFKGELTASGLRWGKLAGGNHFGFYRSATDTILISATLDSADVPAYVVDFVVYHECLHKVMGSERAGSVTRAHSPAFRQRERAFRQYAQAEKALQQIARRRR
ncbi:MAG: hypothetical protein ACPGXK_06115 [Phycisphaerae bacterium]